MIFLEISGKSFGRKEHAWPSSSEGASWEKCNPYNFSLCINCVYGSLITQVCCCLQRLSETLDAEVRRWSGGKEGNLRALLSTLQYVSARILN